MQVVDDLFAFAGGEVCDFFVDTVQPVVDVDSEFLEELTVLGKRVLVEHPHGMAEHDGVRHFHHRRLDMQREQHTGLAGIFHLFFVKVA